jgi:hypothetical protein
MTPTSLWRQLARYSPMLAGASALAAFVAIVPSTSPAASSAGGNWNVPAAGSSGAPGLPGGSGAANGSSAAPGSSIGASGAAGATGPGSGVASGSSALGTGGSQAGTGHITTRYDCSRNKILQGSTCRPPTFVGNNGGATGPGVTDTTVNIVIYQSHQAAQTDAALQEAGVATQAQRQAVLAAWQKYLNTAYETYHRHVNLILWYGNAAPTDAAGSQADAVYVAEQLHAFAVIAATSADSFRNELHRRHIPVFANGQFDQAYYAAHAPDLWGLLPDADLTMDHIAEYACKRLVGHNAQWAGSPTFQQSKRVFGVVYPDGAPIQVNRLKSSLARCGAQVAATKAYSTDVSTQTQQGASIAAAMNSAGVTSVFCLCDPIFPATFTQQATGQHWFPEWIETGLFGSDAALFGRLYDQQQWSHAFGISTLEYPIISTDDPGYNAYRAGDPNGNTQNVMFVSQYFFWAVRGIFSAIELAGPNLNDVTLARGLFSIPSFHYGRSSTYSFGNNGPSQYTDTDNVMEIWWCSTCTAPDGKPGEPFYLNGGKRYMLGQWPNSSPKPFVNDGSPQPARDPNQ